MSDPTNITSDDLQKCAELLKRLTESPALAATVGERDLNALLEAAGRFSRPNKIESQKRHKAFYAARRKKEQLADQPPARRLEFEKPGLLRLFRPRIRSLRESVARRRSGSKIPAQLLRL